MAKWRKEKLTAYGHKLIAKMQAGVNVKFTKIIAGDGIHYQDGELIETESVLCPKQNAEVKDIDIIGKNTVRIRSILSNKSLAKGYFIRELGVMAVAEDEPDVELVYCIALTEEEKADFWPEFELSELRIPISISIATGDSTFVSVDVVNTYAAYEIGYSNIKSELYAENVQDAIDELDHNVDILSNYLREYPLTEFYHGLNSYIDIIVIESDYGYGMNGYGEKPYGGRNGRKLRSTIEYLDRNRIQIYVEKQFETVKSITKVSNKEYLITFNDSTLCVLIVLLTCSGCTEVETHELEPPENTKEQNAYLQVDDIGGKIGSLMLDSGETVDMMIAITDRYGGKVYL